MPLKQRQIAILSRAFLVMLPTPLAELRDRPFSRRLDTAFINVFLHTENKFRASPADCRRNGVKVSLTAEGSSAVRDHRRERA